MTTIPSRLARLSQSSGSLSVAHQRTIQLYRDWCRAAPEICSMYALTCSPLTVRQAIRAEFERNRYIDDPKVIDVLLHKSRQLYQEALNGWTQEPHILGILLAPKERPERSFLEKFYEGKDEDQVLPAATGTLQKDIVH